MASEPKPPSEPRYAGLEPAPEPCAVLMHRADYRLVRTLLSIQHRGATGTLRVEAEGVVTIVRMRDGHPVFVEGGLPADSLGRLLVQRGKISESTLAMIEEQRMLLQGRLKFGEVARRLGVLESEVLDDALRDQVRDKLQRCLHWERNQHTFITEEHGVQALAGAPLHVEPLLLAGVARHFSGERVQDVLSPLWRETVRLRSEREHVGSRFGFGDFEEAMLDQILIAQTIGHVMAGPAARNPRVGHVLVALTLCDQVEAPELDAPDESGPFVIEDLARTPRRSIRVSDAPSPTAAHDSIRPPPPPGDVVSLPGKEKLLADSAFLQGKELLRAGEYGAAADAFREASNLRPSALEYALFAAWSAYLSTGRAGKWRDMLSELCTRTLAQDRHLAFAHHVKGQLALESKDLDTAKNSLLRALELDPQDDEAKRLLDRMKN
ncbi:MAG: hypothetical protein QM778_01450 [Myxococcales bacterium]